MAKRSSAKAARVVVQNVMDRIRDIRDRQVTEGSFDCYAKAFDGYCDQGDCSYREECLEMSSLVPAAVPARIER